MTNGDNPELLLQDCNKKLSRWFANKVDARRVVREVCKMVKFKSEWYKTIDDFTFPEDMPQEMRNRVINRRRQILVHSYLNNGVGEQCISTKLFTKISNELQELQAVWGTDFNFYDYLFDGWDESQEDHLITNRGIDKGVVDHALSILDSKKKRERSMASVQ